ncbi:MAG TPA: VWA domain-containing protein [Ramlibacter sp.]
MAEAEDVITDVARHATVYAQNLWRRHRPAAAGPVPVRLADMAQRLDLLVCAVFGRSFRLRVAQPPAPPTWLAGIFRRNQLPAAGGAVPATDGHSIWLPASVGPADAPQAAAERLRTMALQQAIRALRGSAAALPPQTAPDLADLYLLLEARAADDALVRLLPGIRPAVERLRRHALAQRPPLAHFPASLRPFESLVRAVLGSGVGEPLPAVAPGATDWPDCALPAAPDAVLAQAKALHAALGERAWRSGGAAALWRDEWTGELQRPPAVRRATRESGSDDSRPGPPATARLARRPAVREAVDDEDDERPGAWMVQPAVPHEQAEDPMGLQRPTDRDSATPAEEFADALSELPEARLVSTPAKPREVLLSDDPPSARAVHEADADPRPGAERIDYPEWDWRAGAYRSPGATVLLLPAAAGPREWIDRTLAQRQGMLREIRRRFELLRAQRVRLRNQLDGDDVDLQAWLDGQADWQAGLSMTQRLYQADRRSRRDMAIMLLIDVSGSTDSWIAAERRVIDVAREALLLVCVALDGMAEPYSVLAFSGEGRQGVTVRGVKRFDERHGAEVAQRIAGLEPERSTRAGAAIRHATAVLMRQPAEHRLLLLLSDGKPNDVDEYEGRYGVEDMRQAVTEAKLQGVRPFCLTIDRQAASYLPAVFGPNQYALLPRPELLPTVLLDWLRRLVTS